MGNKSRMPKKEDVGKPWRLRRGPAALGAGAGRTNWYGLVKKRGCLKSGKDKLPSGRSAPRAATQDTRLVKMKTKVQTRFQGAKMSVSRMTKPVRRKIP